MKQEVLTEEHRAMFSSGEKEQGQLDTHPAGRLAWSSPGHPGGWHSFPHNSLQQGQHCQLESHCTLGHTGGKPGHSHCLIPCYRTPGERCLLGLEPRVETWPGQGGASMVGFVVNRTHAHGVGEARLALNCIVSMNQQNGGVGCVS